MSKLHFVTSGQRELLETALDLTESDGFMADARAIAAYLPREGKDSELLGVAVFESFRGRRAEMHLGYTEGRNLTREMIQTLTLIAFHPRHFNLDTLLARVPVKNVNAICTLLKIGFEIEYRDRGSVAGNGDGIVLSLSRDDILASAGPSDSDYRPQMAEQQE